MTMTPEQEITGFLPKEHNSTKATKVASFVYRYAQNDEDMKTRGENETN
jgi:hypothetical protein